MIYEHILRRLRQHFFHVNNYDAFLVAGCYDGSITWPVYVKDILGVVLVWAVHRLIILDIQVRVEAP